MKKPEQFSSRLASRAGEAIPEPAVGEVWRSPNARVQPRAVAEIGPHPTWAETVIWFSTPDDRSGMPRRLSPAAWRAWARRCGARPVRQDDAQG